jgi:flagellar protein FlaG
VASVSASSLVLFIAALLVAASVAGVMTDSVADISESLEDESLDAAQRIDTDVAVISDAGSDAVYDPDTETVTVLVKNTGRATLSSDPERLDLLLDGRYVPADRASTTVLGADHWAPGAVLRVEIDRRLESGEHRAVVVVDGDESTLRFAT